MNPPKLALLLPGFAAGTVCVLISNVAVDKLPGNSLSSRDLMVNGWLVGWMGKEEEEVGAKQKSGKRKGSSCPAGSGNIGPKKEESGGIVVIFILEGQVKGTTLGWGMLKDSPSSGGLSLFVSFVTSCKNLLLFPFRL